MIRRLLWLLVGVGLGIFLMRKLNQIARSYSPTGIAGRAQGGWVSFRDGLKEFGREVAVLSAQREEQLWAALTAEHPTPLPETRRRPATGAGPRHAPDPDSPDARPTYRHGD